MRKKGMEPTPNKFGTPIWGLGGGQNPFSLLSRHGSDGLSGPEGTDVSPQENDAVYEMEYVW